MAIDVIMPQMGESVVEGTIAKWLVKEGDQVAEDQPLVEISTDKVDTEIPSPGAGVISRIIAGEGETIAVGAAIAVIEPAGKAAEAKKGAEPAIPAEPETSSATLSEESHNGMAKPREAKSTRQIVSDEASVASRNQAVAEAESTAGPRRYSPVVLKMAADYGVDLKRVRGSGTGGRITKRDLVAHLESLGHTLPVEQLPVRPRSAAPPPIRPTPQNPSRPQSPPQLNLVRPGGERPSTTPGRPAPAPGGGVFKPPIYEPHKGDAIEPFSRRRKLIAEHMVYSKATSPHVGTVAEVDMSRAVKLRAAHKDSFMRREGFGLTMLPLVAAATVRALREFPRMNASVSGDTLVIRKEINLGIAVDDEEGLLVPIIKSAEGMSVTGIAREIERLRKKIEAKEIAADDLAGGSFTLSNPGREGNLFGLAIINQPQVGILRMGEIKKRPVVIEADGSEAIAIRSMMYLALSYDHRVVDGVLGNRFLFRVARILEEADFEI